jgi:hypothetical protein
VALMRESVVRLPDGSIALRLVEREREILRALLGDLREIVGEEVDPPGLSVVYEAEEASIDGLAPAETPAAEDEPEPDDAATWAGSDDPVMGRLYPDARPDNPAWSRSFRDMIRGDLDDERRENLAVVEGTLDARAIDDGEAEAWLHVLNDLRLVMGTRLDITEEREAEPFDPDDPDAAARVVYAYAGWLEGQFVDVLAAALPDVPEPDTGTATDAVGGDDS